MQKALAILTLSLLSVGAASAVPIAGMDWDTFEGNVGALFAGPSVENFITPGALTIATLENEVYFDNSIYTYVHTVTPTINLVSELNTAFGVIGFNNIAGWSFSDAAAAGGMGLGGGFSIDLDPDGTLDWEVDGALNTQGWGSGESITFFFQSTMAPGLGEYNLINGSVGTGVSYAPAPEPSTYLLFASALGLFALRRRAKK